MNHRGTILLSAAVLLLSACGTPAEFAATFQGDGIYGNFVPQTYQPKSREDFERMAADNLQNRQRDTLVVLVDESPSWRFGLSFGFGPWGWNFGPSWSFGWHSRWYDPWYCGGWYDPWYYSGWYDPWYRSSWYYGGWYDPWYYPYGYYGGWYDPWYHHHHHNHGIWHNQGTYTPRASTRPGTAGYGPASRSAAGVMNRPGASTSSSPRGAGSRSGAYIGGDVPRAGYSPTPVSTSRSGGAIGRSGASSTVRTSTGASTRTSTQSTRSSGTSTRSSASPTRSSSSSSYGGSSSRSSYGGGSSYSGGSHSSGGSYSGGSHSGGGSRR